ncbi:MAG: hypothetical protein IKN99_06270 [Bacteroidales bacterium]|nr:hypothetical protein [Bacteroidales bacterium]
MHHNVVDRAMLVKRMVDRLYQPQSHKGCMLDIYRNHVVKVYPMSEQTFYRYMRIGVARDGYIGDGSNRVKREKRDLPGSTTDANQLSFF